MNQTRERIELKNFPFSYNIRHRNHKGGVKIIPVCDARDQRELAYNIRSGTNQFRGSRFITNSRQMTFTGESLAQISQRHSTRYSFVKKEVNTDGKEFKMITPKYLKSIFGGRLKGHFKKNIGQLIELG